MKRERGADTPSMALMAPPPPRSRLPSSIPPADVCPAPSLEQPSGSTPTSSKPLFLESAEYRRGWHAAKEQFEREQQRKDEMDDRRGHAMCMADETGLSRGQLIEIIEMLQIALRHAGAQTKMAARMGWCLFEGEQDEVAFHRHELSLAQWKYSCDVVYEDEENPLVEWIPQSLCSLLE